MSINKVTLLGNLGADPEVRRTQDGKSVANITIATSDKWKDKSTGEQREKTEWHKCTLWGPLGELAEKYLRKGSKVYLEGTLQTRKWQDKNGADRWTTEVVLQGPKAQLLFLDSAKDRQGGSSGAGGGDASQFTPPLPAGANVDDEIPF